jgi:hypothetical protein
MNVRISILCVLLLVGISVRPAAAGYGSHVGALEQHIRDHLNERMYNSCKAVALTRKTDGIYQGYAQFKNGTRSSLVVTVTDGNIEYAFVQPMPAPTAPNATEAESSAELWQMLDEFEALTQQQQAEIARLQELCRQAGIDPQPPTADTDLEAGHADEAAGLDVAPPQGTELTADSDQQAVFTTQMYGRIQKGMTHREVATLLGAEGERLSSSYFEGATNEVYVWANPDDSHVCVVFQDGQVLLKTQFGLPGIAPAPEPRTEPGRSIEIERFGNWPLARSADGQIRLMHVSLGQWLEALYRVLNEQTPNRPPQISIIEERDQIIVTLMHEDGQGITRETSFYLTYLSSRREDQALSQVTNAEAVLVPARMRVDDRESTNPTLIWRAMVRLAELPAESDESF